MILADKIIMLRKKNGWSQEELADKMDVSRQSVSKWEGAQSVPDLNKILQLGQIFGVSTDYLLKDDIEVEEYSGGSDSIDKPSVRRVSMEEANQFLSIKAFTARRIALAAILCIISPICLLLLGAASSSGMFQISENMAGGLGIIALVLLIAPAVAIFIHCGMKTSQFEYLEKEEIETAYGVTGMVKERCAQYRDTYVRYNILGVSICILSVIPLFISAFMTENDFYIVGALSVMLLLAAVGVYLIIVAGINWASMQKLLQEGDYTVQSKKKSNFTGPIATIYWLLVVALFLGYSFITNDWKNGWIIWAVAGVIFAALMTFCGIFNSRNQ